MKTDANIRNFIEYPWKIGEKQRKSENIREFWRKSGAFLYQNVKNELNIIFLLCNICVYQNYYVPLQSS